MYQVIDVVQDVLVDLDEVVHRVVLMGLCEVVHGVVLGFHVV